MARLTIEQWNRKIARMIENIDHPSVLRDLIEALGEGMYFDNWYCVFFRRDAPPIEVDHSAVEVRRERYISGPYLLDPFYTSFLEGIEAGCYTMRELGVPPDFKESRYYTEYYSPWGAGDEMGYILPVSDDISAHLSMARREPQSRFSKSDIRFAREALPIVHQLMIRIWSRLKPDFEATDAFRVDFHFRMTQAFRSFGTSVLTDREGEITHLLLRGHSAKSIARLLGISPGTVRNHMKSIYAKLEISSQSELFGLFFEALSNVEGDVNVDPLVYLRSGTSLADSDAVLES